MNKFFKAIMCAMFVALSMVVTGCGDDDFPKEVVCPVEGFACDINSTVTLPSGQQYFVNSGVKNVHISDAGNSMVKLIFPSFVAEAEQLRTPITIGEIVVDSVYITQLSSDEFSLKKGEFTCPSTPYFIKGHSIQGTILGGKLRVTMDYTPGNMPFGLTTTFTSK